MLGEVDCGEGLAAARAGLTLAPMDTEWHRQLVGDAVADDVLVVVDRRAEDREPRVKPLELGAVEVGALTHSAPALDLSLLVEPL